MKWYADLGKYLRKASFAALRILVRMKAESIGYACKGQLCKSVPPVRS